MREADQAHAAVLAADEDAAEDVRRPAGPQRTVAEMTKLIDGRTRVGSIHRIQCQACQSPVCRFESSRPGASLAAK